MIPASYLFNAIDDEVSGRHQPGSDFVKEEDNMPVAPASDGAGTAPVQDGPDAGQGDTACEVEATRWKKRRSPARIDRRGKEKPDPWKDPLEAEEWQGLLWFIDLLVWLRRVTSR